jgi:hypothetical protein
MLGVLCSDQKNGQMDDAASSRANSGRNETGRERAE